MSFLDWLNVIGQDADPVRAGFQAQWVYLAVCVAGPVAFGASVGLLFSALERVFGVRLSGKGGH